MTPDKLVAAMPRLRLLRVGLLAAMLALAGQLAFGATVPDLGPAKLGLGVICHADSGPRKPGTPARHNPGCLLCPLCVALATPAPTLVAPPPVPLPEVVRATRLLLAPPATAPPVISRTAAQPRGPPSLA